MKFLVIIGFLVGFAGVLTAAGLAPVGSQERVTSQTTVANNGGRLETFVIRLPADRIVSTGGGASLRVSDQMTHVEPPAGLAENEFTVEQFKLRNVAGDVIGVAVRHWTQADAQGAVTWTANIPSRGSLVWGSVGDPGAELAAALVTAGVPSGIDWQGNITIAMADGERAGTVLAGTEEFADNLGRVDEAWEITGVGSNGELRGTITLATAVRQSP